MSAYGAVAAFQHPDLLLEGGGTFRLSLSADVLASDVSLVIDVYDLDDETHPRGHLGWWKFPTRGLGTTVSGRITGDAGHLDVTLDGGELADSWVNPEPVPFTGLSVAAVLRAKTTNAIVSLERIPAFASAADLANFRGRWNRDLSTPAFALAGFQPPAGSTVHVVASSIVQRDAVGRLCLDVYRLLRQNGIDATLHAEHCAPELNDIVRHPRDLAATVGPDDQVLFFASTFDPSLEVVTGLRCRRKIAYFHRVTDPRLLRVFDPELAMTCQKALAQTARLGDFDRLAANSAASVRDLIAALGPRSRWHADDIAVVPPRLLAGVPDRPPPRSPRTSGARFITVGRLKSNKKLEDVLALFAAYLALDADAECWIVGSGDGKAYRDYLDWVERTELGIPAGRVHWLGSIDDDELARRYQSADAYLCMSEHEGFCLPLHEAMLHGLPVFAYAADAVIETLGGQGLCFETKEFGPAAATIHARLGDPARLARMVEGQFGHAAKLARTMDGRGFLDLLGPGASPGGR